MKTKHLILSALAVALLASACQNKEEDLGAASLSLNPAELSFGTEAGSQSVTLKATRDWVVENLPEWIALDPKSGKASSKDQTVAVTVMPNTGVDRTADLKFTIGLMSKTLKVSQKGEAGNEADALLYFNDFDKAEATKTYGSGSSWPYLDQFDGWKNQSGKGIASVDYAFNKVSARSNSPSNTHNSENYTGSGVNNLLFAQDGYFAVKKIALGGATNIVMTFGTEKYLMDGDNTFNHTEFLVSASIDGEHFASLEYAFPNGDLSGTWDLAKTEFAVPAGTEFLYLHFTSTISSGHRLDDLKLLRGGNGAVPDFANGKLIDLGGGGGGGTVDPSDYQNAPAKTVAEFISTADKNTYFKLSGTVSKFNSNFCSFDLTDASGTIYVYSVDNKDDWSSKISDGGTVTLAGKYQYYEKDSKHEVVNAVILSFDAGTVTPPDPSGGEDLAAVIAKREAGKQIAVQTREVIVSAQTTQGFVVTDGTNHLYVFAQKEPTVKIGDKVLVKGMIEDYFGMPEITGPAVLVNASGATVPYPAAKDITGQMDSYNASVAEYITVQAEAYQSGSYINYKVEGATRGVELSGAPASLTASVKAGDKVTLSGYFNGIQSKRNNVLMILVKVEGGSGSGETPGGDTPGGDTPGGDTPGDNTDYSSDIPWTIITGSTGEGVATINGSATQYPIFKFGTSSKLGEGSMKLPAGAAGFSFIAVGWKDKNSIINFEVGGKTFTFDVPANSSVSGNSPWTITFTAADSVSGEVRLDAPVTEETTVRAFTSGATTNGRCLVFAIKKL